MQLTKLKEALQEYFASLQEAGTGLIEGLVGTEPLFSQYGWREKTSGSLVSARSILVIRPDEIGDVVLTSAFLRELRHNAPEAWITLLVKPGTMNLVASCPYVNEVLEFLPPFPHQAKLPFAGWQQALDRAAQLWVRQYELCLLPRFDMDTCQAAFLAYLSGAACRVGYTEKATIFKAKLNEGFDRLLTHLVPAAGLRHEVFRTLDLLRFLGGRVATDALELWVDEADRHFAAQKLPAEQTLKIALSPGPLTGRRVWPVQNIIELGRGLCRMAKVHFVILGGPGEEASGQLLKQAMPEQVTDLTAKTTLRQTAAILQQCDLYVGRDTGVMHIAAAAGCPVVEVSCYPQSGDPAHFYSPTRFGPWGVLHEILQPQQPLAPCRRICSAPNSHCITQIKPAEVAAAVIRLLEKTLKNSLFAETQEQPTDRPVSGGGRQRKAAPITLLTSLSTEHAFRQKQALATWRQVPHSLVSLNTAEQIRELQPQFPEVEFVEVDSDTGSRFGKPRIYFAAALEYLRQSSAALCGIVNPFTVFLQPGFLRQAAREASDALVYGESRELPALDLLLEKPYPWGVEYCFFERSLLPDYPQNDFCLGLPWWGIWAAAIPLKAGFPVKRIVSPAAGQLWHPAEWRMEHMEYFAKRLAVYFPSPVPVEHTNSMSYIQMLLTELRRHSRPLEFSPFQQD